MFGIQFQKKNHNLINFMVNSLLIYSLGLIIIFLAVIQTSSSVAPSITTTNNNTRPRVYVSFTRWENRSLSPRVYYLLLNQYYNNQTSSPGHEPDNHLNGRGRHGQRSDHNNHLDDFFVSRANYPTTGSPPQSQYERRSKPNISKISEKSEIQFPASGAYSNSPESFRRSSLLQEEEEDSIIYPTPLKKTLNPKYKQEKLNLAEFDNNDSPLTFYSPDDVSDRQQHPQQLHGRKRPQDGTAAAASSPSEHKRVYSGIEIDSYGLTFDIFRVSQADWKRSNVLFSPFSFLNVMALLLLGSNGTTFRELATQLRPSDPAKLIANETIYHESFQNLLDYLTKSSGHNVALDIFNGIFVDKSFPLLKSYREAALERYFAQTNSFDFGTEGEEYKKKVNDLIDYKTKGKIKNVLDGPVDPTTTLSIINTIYFHGGWEKPFMSRITKKKPFIISTNETIQVDMMTNVLTIPYLETIDCRVIGLPYKGNKTGFFILLPIKPGVEGLQEMESNLTYSDFASLLTMKKTQVTLQIPKMRLEGQNTEVKEIFRKLGLESLFDPRAADLSKISNQTGLYIKSIIHKAILDIDENGTEAAATTIATGDRNFDDQPIAFNVNRPFAFCILNIRARTMLFYGRVVKPEPLPTTTTTNLTPRRIRNQ